MIDGLYMNKYQPSTKTIFYQQARLFRRSSDNTVAYCLEPFIFFDGAKSYSPTTNPRNLSKAQIDRISKLVHFGNGYPRHNTMKWYAITQLMIWQTADPSGDYYFTDSLNGNRINLYQNEIQELNNMVNSYNVLPSINNKNYTIVEGNSLEITDTNNVLSNFKTDSKDLTITGNKIKLENLSNGEHKYTFYKEEKVRNRPVVFYQAEGSQNIVNVGDLGRLNASFNVKVINTKIELSKVDKDTKETTPQGEASLDGAIYKLYDMSDKEISTLEIKNNQSVIENIPLGKYYLVEEKAGTGYTQNTNKYEIEITEDNPTVQLVLENKVIEKKITITKKYGEGNTYLNEKDISFMVLNNKGDLIKTITTDENGIVDITLPYGTYKLIQVNSTDGYTKVDPFIIEVKDSEEELIELKDLRIAVPNTHTTSNSNILSILFQILLIIL